MRSSGREGQYHVPSTSSGTPTRGLPMPDLAQRLREVEIPGAPSAHCPESGRFGARNLIDGAGLSPNTARVNVGRVRDRVAASEYGVLNLLSPVLGPRAVIRIRLLRNRLRVMRGHKPSLSVLFEGIRDECFKLDRIATTLGLKGCRFGADHPGDFSVALDLCN